MVVSSPVLGAYAQPLGKAKQVHQKYIKNQILTNVTITERLSHARHGAKYFLLLSHKSLAKPLKQVMPSMYR